MFSSRKPLAIALTLVIMLAMLVPAAMAAPEWVHGVNITSPTQANPAYVNPARNSGVVAVRREAGDKGFKAKFDLSIIGTQVDDILVTIRAIDANNHVAVWKYRVCGGHDRSGNSPDLRLPRTTWPPTAGTISRSASRI